MFPPAHFSRRLLVAFCAAIALWLGGCGDRDRTSYASELDEPYYREGQALLKSGRRQEALTAFLKVIDKRGEDAPESNLEAGLIYQQYVNDPIEAYHHFRKYLALRPNSPQAALVKQRIDAAIRDFARTLPARPLENPAERVDLIAAMDKLKLENDLLKQQIADIKAGRDTSDIAVVKTNAPTVSSAAPTAPAATNESKFALSMGGEPTVRTRPAPATTAPASKPLAPPTRPSNQATPKPATTQANQPVRGRKHTVQKGDTLMSLAQKYYGNRSKWRDIYAANRSVMKNENDIRLGMELTIP